MSSPGPAVAATPTTEVLAALRREVRDFLAEQRGHGMQARVNNWMAGFSPEFSRLVAARGWVGMTWPRDLGGHQRSELERFVVTEELVAAGAPVAAHWGADRQIGSMLLRFGSPELQADLLPRFARAELFVCAGMSEPEAGSDLASLRTRAARVDGGYRISGTKVWVSHAHRSDLMVVLCRTDPDAERHHGLSQLIVDLDTEGVTVRPIRLMTGEHHFNEVTFDEVLVPDSRLIGEPGAAWEQLRAELVLERCGPDRYLSTFPLLAETIAALGGDTGTAELLGGVTARVRALRDTSLSILDGSIAPEDGPVAAAVVKARGTALEQELVELVRSHVEPEAVARSRGSMFDDAVLSAPMFTLRGGATEILRTIIARGSSPSDTRPGLGPVGDEHPDTALLLETAQQVLAGSWPAQVTADPEPLETVWKRLEAVGLTTVALPEDAGGPGLGDELSFLVARVAGRTAAPVPVVDSAVLAGWALAQGGVTVPHAPVAFAVGSTVAVTARTMDSGQVRIQGTLSRVPWLPVCAHVVVGAEVGGQAAVVLLDTVDLGLDDDRNIADEPCGGAVVDVEVDDGRWATLPIPLDALVARGALARAAQMTGALEETLVLTARHAEDREQFGRPLARLQAVQHLIARLAEVTRLAATALTTAVREPTAINVATSKIVAGRAATEAAALAHQVHGAIGVTVEHPLHRYTRRLLAWRDEFGTESWWERRLGLAVLDRLDVSLWPAMADDDPDGALWGGGRGVHP